MFRFVVLWRDMQVNLRVLWWFGTKNGNED